MLDPGKTDATILRFLAFLSCVIAGVDEYQELLRASVASAGNDCRLGGNEAPPAIVSIYLGDALEKIINSVMSGKSFETLKDSKMDLGVSILPQIMRDSSDRNRTSPFAFTANKFEFRMPGSQMNLSDSVMVLNTAIAKSMKDFNNLLEEQFSKADRKLSKNKVKTDDIVLAVVAKTLKAHKRIIFNGDGYSTSWEKEAKKRGLSNNVTTADALVCLMDKKSIKLFEDFGVLSRQELESRYIIALEIYNKLINIESRVMHRMAKRTYLPAISDYAANVAAQVNEIKSVDKKINIKSLKDNLSVLCQAIDKTNKCLVSLDKLRDEANKITDEQKKANFNAKKLIPAMKELRLAVDSAEHIVSKEY